jgi:uncharacterized membrane protein YdjX (TVP38/TMEM64 family)
MTPTRTRFVLLVLLIAGLAVAAALLPVRQIPDAVADIGAWGPPAAIAIGALLLAALVPRTAISIACGALFGVIGGGFVALGGAVVAFVITFVIGRRLGRAAVAARTGGRIASLDGWLSRTGLLSVVVVRLLPVAPYGLVGYAYGTTSVLVRNYVLGSLIGAAPSAFAYAAVGAAVVRPGAVGLVSFAPAAAGFVVTAIATVYWYRTARRNRRRADGSDEVSDIGNRASGPTRHSRQKR